MASGGPGLARGGAGAVPGHDDAPPGRPCPPFSINPPPRFPPPRRRFDYGWTARPDRNPASMIRDARPSPECAGAPDLPPLGPRLPPGGPRDFDHEGVVRWPCVAGRLGCAQPRAEIEGNGQGASRCEGCLGHICRSLPGRRGNIPFFFAAFRSLVSPWIAASTTCSTRQPLDLISQPEG